MSIGGKRQGYYKHAVPEAKIDPAYPRGQQRQLVNSDEYLTSIFERLKDKSFSAIAVDTETTGLNHRVDSLVGISIAFDRVASIYLPVGHKVGQNVSLHIALQFLAHLISRSTRVFLYNKNFDYRFLKKAGLSQYIDMTKVQFFDVSILVFNADTNIKLPSLKWASLHFLGWKMRTYEEVMGDESKVDFSFNDPSVCYEYACDDALSTYNLAVVLSYVFSESNFICQLDNAVLAPIMAMEESTMHIDIEWVKKVDDMVDTKLAGMEMDIYKQVGYQFSINSPPQVVKALNSIGVRPIKLTGKGAVSTSDDALTEIRDQHKVVGDIIDYRSLRKTKSAYTTALQREFIHDEGGIHLSYKTNMVPTGRLASGSESKNAFFAKINGQGIPKPHSHLFSVEKLQSDSMGILGYSFKEADKGQPNLIEGYAFNQNIRHSFIPPSDDFYWVSCDYKAQELRLPANFSKEPVWVNTFMSGGDLHTEMTNIIFGKENYSKDKRTIVKAINFGALYGASEYSFANTLKIPIDEAKALLDLWWSKLRVLKRWSDGVQKFGMRNGYVKTWFGRKRNLAFWFQSAQPGFIGFARRSCVNSIVQGTAADIMRIVLVQVYQELKPFIDSGDLIMISSIHDEVNYAIRRSRIYDILPKIISIMEIKVPEWVVPMTVDTSIGVSWGHLFPFKYINGVLVPLN